MGNAIGVVIFFTFTTIIAIHIWRLRRYRWIQYQMRGIDPTTIPLTTLLFQPLPPLIVDPNNPNITTIPYTGRNIVQVAPAPVIYSQPGAMPCYSQQPQYILQSFPQAPITQSYSQVPTSGFTSQQNGYSQLQAPQYGWARQQQQPFGVSIQQQHQMQMPSSMPPIMAASYSGQPAVQVVHAYPI